MFFSVAKIRFLCGGRKQYFQSLGGMAPCLPPLDPPMVTILINVCVGEAPLVSPTSKCQVLNIKDHSTYQSIISHLGPVNLFRETISLWYAQLEQTALLLNVFVKFRSFRSVWAIAGPGGVNWAPPKAEWLSRKTMQKHEKFTLLSFSLSVI